MKTEADVPVIVRGDRSEVLTWIGEQMTAAESVQVLRALFDRFGAREFDRLMRDTLTEEIGVVSLPPFAPKTPKEKKNDHGKS